MGNLYDRELEVALDAARRAGEIQTHYIDRIGAVETKGDDTPVTVADRECEEAIRSTIHSAFSADGFLGEEYGEERGTSDRTWIIDPIDGTRSYIKGFPYYSTLIALRDGDELVVGVIHLEAMQQTCWGCRGRGAFVNGTRIDVSDQKTVDGASGAANGFLNAAATSQAQALLKLMGKWSHSFGFLDAYSFMAVAQGKLDLCICMIEHPWDNAAIACIVREAGGRFSDIHGQETIHGGSTVVTNGALHDEVIEAFGQAAP